MVVVITIRYLKNDEEDRVIPLQSLNALVPASLHSCYSYLPGEAPKLM